MPRLRLTAVSFLNARPIVYGIEPGLALANNRFDLRFDLPSRCAAAIASGDADLALMPLGSFADAPDEFRIVPGIAIASRGPVRTVMLMGDVPWEKMDTILLDEASRTSHVLVRLLTRERGLAPSYERAEHDRIADLVGGRRGALIDRRPVFFGQRALPSRLRSWRRVDGARRIAVCLRGVDRPARCRFAGRCRPFAGEPGAWPLSS